jgi:hypothetical protein
VNDLVHKSPPPVSTGNLRQIKLVCALPIDFFKNRSNIIFGLHLGIVYIFRLDLISPIMHFAILKSTNSFCTAQCCAIVRGSTQTVPDAYCFIRLCYGVTNCRPLTCNLSDFSTTILNSNCYIHNKNLLARRQPQIELRMFIIVLSVIKNLRNRIKPESVDGNVLQCAGYSRACLVLCVTAISTASRLTSRLLTDE